MDSKGKGKSPAEPKLAKEEVTGELLALFISYLQGCKLELHLPSHGVVGSFNSLPLPGPGHGVKIPENQAPRC
jgi:hypothetical protein